MNTKLENQIQTELMKAYGPNAKFRPGQKEALESVLQGKKTLVVQKTGWGKSLVYFLSIKILRQNGFGPALIVSPLLALMKNQIDSAAALNLRTATINSDNRDNWSDIYSSINQYDALIVSPERLSNPSFLEAISQVNISFLVVDEAHCISEWGHDFRPDYQRISKIIDGLPKTTAILGTTATAPDWVIRDVAAQLGKGVAVHKGDLSRNNIALQVMPEWSKAKRIASIITVLNDPKLSSSQGLVYCLTRKDCQIVSEILVNNGLAAAPYYSNLQESERMQQNLLDFESGKIRILVSTCKLGMGYDNENIDFVIHFQRPKNLVEYYQEIGRAGRKGQQSYALLYPGTEDDDINNFFIQGKKNAAESLATIYQMCKTGASQSELLGSVNMSQTELDGYLKYLSVHEYIFQDTGRVSPKKWHANPVNQFDPEKEKIKRAQLAENKRQQYLQVQELIASPQCKMSKIMAVLSGRACPDCGSCSSCQNRYLFDPEPSKALHDRIKADLSNRSGTISPRKQNSSRKKLKHLCQSGWVLADQYYSPIGQTVKTWKYPETEAEQSQHQNIQKDLCAKSAALLQKHIESNQIDLVIPVPSLRRPDLVPDFAQMLAQYLHLDCIKDALIKTEEGIEQKTLLNSSLQEKNIRDTVALNEQTIPMLQNRRILLVDDMVDSRWTFAVISELLLENGAQAVFPFALVRTGSAE